MHIESILFTTNYLMQHNQSVHREATVVLAQNVLDHEVHVEQLCWIIVASEEYGFVFSA